MGNKIKIQQKEPPQERDASMGGVHLHHLGEGRRDPEGGKTMPHLSYPRYYITSVILKVKSNAKKSSKK